MEPNKEMAKAAYTYYTSQLAEIEAYAKKMDFELEEIGVRDDLPSTADFDINHAMKQRKELLARKTKLAADVKTNNAQLDENEASTKAYLVHNGMQNVKLAGLFQASLVNKTYYADEGGFKAWALTNDPTCLTVTVKQSGIADYRLDHENELPPGIKATNILSVSFTKSK